MTWVIRAKVTYLEKLLSPILNQSNIEKIISIIQKDLKNKNKKNENQN
jgi:hypothetical protein